MATTAVSLTSVRYQRLLECIPKALEKCRHQIDVEGTIRMCYGEGDGNEVFCTMLEGILDQFHTEVAMDVTSFLQDKKVEEKLLKLEAIIRKVDHEIALQKKASLDDKESALAALKSARLPDQVSAEDMIRYQSYQRMIQDKKRVEEEISLVKLDIARLEADQGRYMEIASGHVQEMNSVKLELEQSADLCSLVK